MGIALISIKRAFQRLLKQMSIFQVKITTHNHYANGVVERGRLILRETIIEECKGKLSKWPERIAESVSVYSVTTS